MVAVIALWGATAASLFGAWWIYTRQTTQDVAALREEIDGLRKHLAATRERVSAGGEQGVDARERYAAFSRFVIPGVGVGTLLAGLERTLPADALVVEFRRDSRQGLDWLVVDLKNVQDLSDFISRTQALPFVEKVIVKKRTRVPPGGRWRCELEMRERRGAAE